MAYSEAQKKATIKYAAKAYKRVPLDLRKEDYAEMYEHIKQRGETVNGFIKRAISETMERDKTKKDR